MYRHDADHAYYREMQLACLSGLVAHLSSLPTSINRIFRRQIKYSMLSVNLLVYQHSNIYLK